MSGLSESGVVAFLATAQPERSKAFYTGVIGLRLVDDGPFALVFQAGATMLRIQKVEEWSPPQHTALGWDVPDIRATLESLAGRGAVFNRYSFLPQDDLGIWTTPDGSKVAWFNDPDGNVLSLTEFGRTAS